MYAYKKSPLLAGILLGDLLNDSSKALGSGLCEESEHLAVDGHILLLHCVDEARVGEGRLDSVEPSVDANVPKFAEVILFVAAVCKRVLTRVEDSLLCCTLLL